MIRSEYNPLVHSAVRPLPALASGLAPPGGTLDMVGMMRIQTTRPAALE
jgi:hypothetical protein